MLVIIGSVVVTGAVLAGFVMSGGHVMSLWHPSELVTIGGASLGALLMMSPVKVIKDLLKWRLVGDQGKSVRQGGLP